jgi:diguanylate cyclase (GGDEF)-like protein
MHQPIRGKTMTHSTQEKHLGIATRSGERHGAGTRLLSVEGATALRLPEPAWQLSALLQTTLDTEKVIELFARELARQVPHDSFTYQHPDKALSVVQGTPARNTASYRLLLENRVLGEITLTRGKRFSDAEVELVEMLISGLLFALRNALMYREAIDSALKDPLTGAANRAALEAALKREISLSQRHKLPLSVLLLDIDKFKRINDTHGHAVGDKVLQALTRAVTDCIRSTDVLARYGGEEFVVVLPGTESFGAELLANRILAHLDEQACAVKAGKGQDELYFTASIGVTSLKAKDTASKLVDRADQAMYAAKQEGGSRVRVA